jgi:hypothetical protein
MYFAGLRRAHDGAKADVLRDYYGDDLDEEVLMRRGTSCPKRKTDHRNKSRWERDFGILVQ